MPDDVFTGKTEEKKRRKNEHSKGAPEQMNFIVNIVLATSNRLQRKWAAEE